jgi:nucleoside phosphorylase
VFWTITATRKTDSALPNVLDLAAVVEYHGPFQGMVKVDAKSLHGSRYCQAPWSTDDPLIFDGMTPKGRLAVKGDFATLTEEDWLQYFCETSPTSSTISGKIDSSTSRPATSHESSRYARPATLDEFHVAVICALRDEQTAVEACFDEFWDAEKSYPKAAGDTNSYTLGRIGSHNVVLAHMSNMGNSSAASVAASLKITFQRIRFALVVGICGGVPRPSKSFKPEIWLGDVVISTGVVQYDLGWREPTKFKRRDTLESNLGRPPTDIRNILMSIEDGRNYSNLRERLWDQLPSLWQTQKTRYPFRYPGLDEDKLFKASYPHRHRGELSKCMQCKDGQNEACEKSKLSSCAEVGCDLAMLAPRSHSGREKVQNSTIQAGFRGDMLKPAVHFGIIASGNQVMKSGEDRDAIAKDTDAIAFEMEGAGVWDQFPCVVIKGVCDYSDSHKNYDWQIYSALTAASCMKAFLHEWSRQNPDGTM